jgi:hypothetical protein
MGFFSMAEGHLPFVFAKQDPKDSRHPMPVVGDHPESGVRFVLERPRDPSPPWRYRGDAFTKDARVALEVLVTEGGEVRVGAPSNAPASAEVPPSMAEKARLLFRALHKQAKDSGDGAPPRKVVRWRSEA